MNIMASSTRDPVSLIAQSRKGRACIYQGSAQGAVEAESRNFDAVVLCAEEWQPDKSAFGRPSLRVIYAPNNDDGSPLTREQVQIAIAAAREVAQLYRQDKRVLVTCMMGRNRSGLVTAIALTLLFGISGRDAMRHVKRSREDALTNDFFNKFLGKIPRKEKV